MHFASTSVMPTTSNTARIGPPAMIPVPSEAGWISTFEAPWRPMTACWRVPLRRLTRNILRRASSSAFCTATGTSRALPLPIPIPPSPSPTTVSAAKPSTRAPFTTLVTRLTATIFSRRPSDRSSEGCILGCILAIVGSLELQSAFARGLGERLDAPVVLEARAVEGDLVDAELQRLLGDALADRRRRGLVAAVRHRPAHVLLDRRRGREDLRAVVRQHLRVDVLVRPVHRQA